MAKKLKTPYNLPRVVIVACYFIVVSATGMAIGAADPIQRLMQMNGAFSYIEDPIERNAATESIAGVGYSLCLLSGIFIGIFTDLVGHKIVAVSGLLAHAAGYLLLFFTSSEIGYYIGAGCFGFALQCILNSHMHVGAYFPQTPSLILAVVGSGPDISYFVPTTLLSLARTYGVRHVVFLYLVAVVLPCILVDLILVPMRAPSVDDEEFELPNDKILLDEEKQLNDTEVEPLLDERKIEKKPISVLSQTLSLDFMLFAPLFVITFLRRKHMAVSVRSIFTELDTADPPVDGNFYADIYSTLVPYGFIPAIVWGALVDRFGSIGLMFASNTICAVYLISSMIPIMALQGFTIFMFIIYQSFVLAMALSYLATTFGFDTLIALQGILAFIGGTTSLIMDVYWQKIIINYFLTYRNTTIFILGVTIVLYIIPIALLLLNKFRSNKTEKLPKYLTDDAAALGDLDSIMPPTICYDRNSLVLMKNQSGQKKSLRNTQSS